MRQRPINFVDDWAAPATPRPPTTVVNPPADVISREASLVPRAIGERFTRVAVEDLAGAPYVDFFWGGIDLSPDGAEVACSWNRTGSWELYIVPLAGARIYQLTAGTQRSVWPRWSPDGATIAFLRDVDGDERFAIHLIDRDGKRERRLSAAGEVSHRDLVWSPDGSRIAYGANRGTAHGLEIIDAATGDRRPLTDGTHDTHAPAWSPDGEWLVFHSSANESAPTDVDLYAVSTRGGEPRRLETRGGAAGESLEASFSADGRSLAFSTNLRGRYEIAIAPFADGAIGRVDITTRLAFDATQPTWRPDGRGLLYLMDRDADRSVRRLFTASRADTPVADTHGVHRSVRVAPDSEAFVSVRSSARRPWDVWLRPSDREEPRALTDSLGGTVDPATLVDPVHVRYPSEDGREIPALLYVPHAEATRGGGPPPAIIYLHGGPTDQHFRWWDSTAQVFANRGYVVLAPNVRGSTGYGREFREANRGDWGGKDLRDVIAGVNWLEQREIADGGRVAAYGGSYGGYLTLMALALEPDRWAAGCSVVGIVNLRTLAETTRGDLREKLTAELGDPERDAALYRERSPLTHAREITAPLLILQGAHDPRVPRTEAEQLVKALADAGRTYEYHVYEDEGHGFRLVANRVDALRRATAFFDRHLQA